MATIDILLPGMAWGTTVGSPAFCTVALVESAGTKILVDTAHVGRRVVLEEALASRGLRPADIDLILMTHAHWDHAQNFDLFPDTPMLLHGKERAYAQQPHRNDWATPQWTGAALETHVIQEVSEGDELAIGENARRGGLGQGRGRLPGRRRRPGHGRSPLRPLRRRRVRRRLRGGRL